MQGRRIGVVVAEEPVSALTAELTPACGEEPTGESLAGRDLRLNPLKSEMRERNAALCIRRPRNPKGGRPARFLRLDPREAIPPLTSPNESQGLVS